MAVTVIAGSRPPNGRAEGSYGSSRALAALAWVWLATLIIPLIVTRTSVGTGWQRAWDLCLMACIAGLAITYTFTSALVINASGIRRRWHAQIRWDEVSEVLLPRRAGGAMRVRLADRTVVLLRQLDDSRASSLAELAGMHAIPS